MNTSITNTQLETMSKQMLRGEFSPTEASELIRALTEAQINFLNLQSLCQYEVNHDINRLEIEREIESLIRTKKELKEAINLAGETGCKLRVEGTFNLKLVK